MSFQHVVYRARGGPEVLQLQTTHRRAPEPEEIRVKVEAAGVANADRMVRRGLYPTPPPIGSALGYDVVGRVEACGRDVQSVRPGDRVAALLLEHGGYSEVTYLNAKFAVRVPESLDPARSVALVLNYLTAHQMLHRMARVQPGQRIVVTSAAGGVGTALLELGRVFGLTTVGICSRAKAGFASNRADTVYAYDDAESLAALAGECGRIDHGFDAVGGRLLQNVAQLVRPEGTLTSFGFLAVDRGSRWAMLPTLGRLLWWWIKPRGPTVRFNTGLPQLVAKDPQWYRETLAELFDSLATGALDPIVSERIPLSQARRAHERFERREFTGKLVLIPGS